MQSINKGNLERPLPHDKYLNFNKERNDIKREALRQL